MMTQELAGPGRAGPANEQAWTGWALQNSLINGPGHNAAWPGPEI